MVDCELEKNGYCKRCEQFVPDYNPAIPTKRKCEGSPKNLMRICNKYDNFVQLRNIFEGCHCFYIGAGPSLLKQDLTFLSSKGIHTFAVNNIAANLVKPNLWCCVDTPKSFHDYIWLDSTIMKFVPADYEDTYFLINDGEDGLPAKFAPNTFTYALKSSFDHRLFLDERDFCWGCEKNEVDSLGLKGGRMVMFVAIKFMYYLGFKYVYLLGCDFDMQHDPAGSGKGLTYAFDQYKHAAGCKTNNDCYQIANERFKALQPNFIEHDFLVYNCTPDSKLTAFPTLTLADAIRIATRHFTKPAKTQGMYG